MDSPQTLQRDLMKTHHSNIFREASMKALRSWVIALSGAGLFLLAGPAQGEGLDLVLSGTESYGSGASVSDDLYSPGGVPNVGLFIGQPNPFTRNDRVLLKYDIESLLLMKGKLQKAELGLTVDHYGTKEPVLDLEVEYLPDATGELTGKELNRTDADVIGTVEVTKDDATYTGQDVAARDPVVEKTVDVTTALKDALERGNTFIIFRLRSPMMESTPANFQNQGLTLSHDPLRTLVLHTTLAD
jgi:hypothetical protein